VQQTRSTRRTVCARGEGGGGSRRQSGRRGGGGERRHSNRSASGRQRGCSLASGGSQRGFSRSACSRVRQRRASRARHGHASRGCTHGSDGVLERGDQRNKVEVDNLRAMRWPRGDHPPCVGGRQQPPGSARSNLVQHPFNGFNTSSVGAAAPVWACPWQRTKIGAAKSIHRLEPMKRPDPSHASLRSAELGWRGGRYTHNHALLHAPQTGTPLFTPPL